MFTPRQLAATTGMLYLVTFATSIPALALKQDFLHNSGSAASLQWAVALELLLALACVGTAVAFYPIGRRHAPALALGFVISRALEAATILLGVIALLAASTMRSLGVDDGVERGLVALHDWAFLIGPGLLPAINAALFGTLLLRSKLVPRIIPLIGLVGAPILAASALCSVFGVLDQVSPVAGLAALPIAAWEFSIGVWLLARGTRAVAEPTAVLAS